MMQETVIYDKKWLVWSLVGIVAMCAAMKATGGAGFVLIYPLILVAFSKNRPELMLYCLLMTAVVTVGNPFIAPKDVVFSVAARGVYLMVGIVLTLQLAGQRSSRMTTPLLSLLAYIAYMAIVSSVGWQPMISYLKIILFLVVFFAGYSVANAASIQANVRPERLRAVVLAVASFVILGSVALIPFPAIGKMGAAQILAQGASVTSVGLFQGVTFHSQTLGPLVAAVATLLLSDILFALRRWDKLYLCLLMSAPVVVYYTSSRTAMGTFLAGVCFALFLFVNTSGRNVGTVWKQRAISAVLTVGIIGAIVLFAVPGPRERVMAFIFKVGEQSVAEEQISFEKFASSRQGLVDTAMENFRKSPWIGNGFQVGWEMEQKEYSSWKQYLSAPIEKGVWIYAVLEEGGIFGMLLFVLFLLIAFPALIARKAYIGGCVLFVFVVSNLGEFTFFSMSANGGIMWALVFSGLALDAQRLRQQQPMWGEVEVPFRPY